MRGRVSLLETEVRMSNLVLHGLEEPLMTDVTREEAEKEATQATVNLCVQTLGIHITEADISTAYRLPRRRKEKYRPVIAKFSSIRIRNLIYKSRMQLQKTQIFINEHLTSANARIYATARSLVKEGKAASTWTTGGIVFLLQTEGQGHNKDLFSQ